MLLARIYEVRPLLCPACRGRMGILAFLTDPPVVATILLHLELPHKAPPISPARGPRAPRELDRIEVRLLGQFPIRDLVTDARPEPEE